ncbi:hypothetical protein APHAL10511_000392 [Amanita phalloides]|nr:hypothetical protein APHAL10511_000392 [Amanita phalloides]
MQSPQSTSSQWPSTSTLMDDLEMPQSPHSMQLDLTDDEITDLRDSVHSLLEVDTSMRSAKSLSPVPTPPPRMTAYEILTMIDNMPYETYRSQPQSALHAPMAKIENTPSGLVFIPEISPDAHLMSEVDQWNRAYANERSWHTNAFTCAGPAFRQPMLQDWPIDDGLDLEFDEFPNDVFMAPHNN